MQNNILPTLDRIIVKRLEAEAKTSGGIIIPENSKEKPIKGKVVSVGPGARDNNGKNIPIELAIGDIVIFGKYSGTEIKHENEDFLIIKESDILATIK